MKETKILKIQRGLKLLKEKGIITFLKKIKLRLFDEKDDNYEYKVWIREKENLSELSYSFDVKPLIVIIIIVNHANKKTFQKCIQSIQNQYYKKWKLCFYIKPELKGWLKRTIKKLPVQSYTIYETFIEIKENIRSEYVAFVDENDILAKNALLEMVVKLQKTDYQYLYSDEDTINKKGNKRFLPKFKPDWSPDTLLSFWYTGRLSLYQTKLFKEIKDFDFKADDDKNLWEYDLVLKFTERATKICHVSKVLYHKREEKLINNLQQTNLRARKEIIEATLRRRNIKGNVEYIENTEYFREVYCVNDNPLVSIIIPSKDHPNILELCIKSIKYRTDYHSYEIIIIDNGSDEQKKIEYEKICKQYKCRYKYNKEKFNFSKMCNRGAKEAKGEMLLFLNDDIEIIQKDWLTVLVGHCNLFYIGAVGAKLYYPDSTLIQHAGVVNIDLGPIHALWKQEDCVEYYMGRNRAIYNFSAVTGACLLIRKSVFMEIKGFDESFPVSYNDMDLCYKLLEKGYYNVLRNDIVLYHHESLSRGDDKENREKEKRLLEERKRLYKLHPFIKTADPYYNNNLIKTKSTYEIIDLDQL